MNDQSLDFLKRLLATPGPSGDEAAAARLWREHAGSFALRKVARFSAVPGSK